MTAASAARHGSNRPSRMFFWVAPDRPTVARGEGIYLWDEDGKRYIDASAGPSTCNIGHGNARVRQAMLEQAEKISYAFRPLFMNEPAEAFAAELVEMAPEGLDMAFFVSGGSEAVEAALKLARQHAVACGEGSRFKVISLIPSYHGCTLGALGVTGDPAMSAAFAPMISNMPKIPTPFCNYRPAGQSAEDCAIAHAEMLETQILNQGPETVLAFIMEPVGGASTAALVAPEPYHRRIREICDRYGVLLIYDEILCGAGRTGKYLAAEHFGVTPDIVAMAKGLSAGYMPMGAILASQRIIDAVYAAAGFLHGHTYSASPLACAVARAVLAEMHEHDLIGNAARMGAILKTRLEALLDEFEMIGEVRGKGLLLGFDIIADRQTGQPLPPELNAYQRLFQEAYDRGLIIYSRRVMDGRRGDQFLITPPLTITEDEIDEIMGLLVESLRAFAPEARAARKAA